MHKMVFYPVSRPSLIKSYTNVREVRRMTVPWRTMNIPIRPLSEVYIPHFLMLSVLITRKWSLNMGPWPHGKCSIPNGKHNILRTKKKTGPSINNVSTMTNDLHKSEHKQEGVERQEGRRKLEMQTTCDCTWRQGYGKCAPQTHWSS